MVRNDDGTAAQPWPGEASRRRRRDLVPPGRGPQQERRPQMADPADLPHRRHLQASDRRHPHLPRRDPVRDRQDAREGVPRSHRRLQGRGEDHPVRSPDARFDEGQPFRRQAEPRRRRSPVQEDPLQARRRLGRATPARRSRRSPGRPRRPKAASPPATNRSPRSRSRPSRASRRTASRASRRAKSPVPPSSPSSPLWRGSIRPVFAGARSSGPSA